MQSVEGMIPTRDPALRASPVALVRDPLFWTAMLAVVGATVGLVGTFRQAAAFASYTPETKDIASVAIMQASGEVLVVFSLFSVLLLPGNSRRPGRVATVVGGFLILLLIPAAPYSIKWFLARTEVEPNPSFYAWSALYSYLCIPSLLPLVFTVTALIHRR